MKSIILSAALAFVTLLSVNTAQAQAVKFHVKEPPTVEGSYEPDGSGNTVFELSCSGTVYGCGNAKVVRAFIEAEGTATSLCYNGGNDPGPVPGQTNFSIRSDEQTFQATNGHASFDITAVLAGSCKGGGRRWTNEVSNVDISKLTLWVNGVPIDLTPYLQQ